METINLTIPTMKSHHCQMMVTNAVKSVGGSITALSPTKAEIELTNGVAKNTVIQAIQKAGYKVAN